MMNICLPRAPSRNRCGHIDQLSAVDPQARVTDGSARAAVGWGGSSPSRPGGGETTSHTMFETSPPAGSAAPTGLANGARGDFGVILLRGIESRARGRTEGDRRWRQGWME